MYEQLMADMTRQMTTVWQTVGILVGSFAVFALTEKNLLPTDLAVALVVAMSGWSVAHNLDGAYWYNRNLAMITNIERQFLLDSDAGDVHYYFARHRPGNKMITHFRIQCWFSASVAALLLVWHFAERVVPRWEWGGSFDLSRAAPYIVLGVGAIGLLRLRSQRNTSYGEFLKNSPGRLVSDKGLDFGPGHGH